VAEHINGPLYWEQLGKSGLPVAFVHPNPMDHTCWIYQMAHLSTWFRCIGIDLPGYGKSPKASPGLTMQDVAQACWEAIEEVTTEPAIIVGESVGSTVVQHMANMRPEQTLAVVVSGTGFGGNKEFTVKRRGQYSARGVAFRHDHTFQDYSPGFRANPLASYFARIFVERNRWADADTIVEMFRALGEPDPEWLHSGIKAPMLVITGSEDNSHDSTWELQRNVPDCELVSIGGAGHACNMEQPWEWDAIFLEFLERRGLFEGVGADIASTGAPILGGKAPTRA
jgi:pimeloyl-ACP methyl ester carboxylesterase